MAELYHKVDLDAWPRREYWTHYMHEVRCTYAITGNIDIAVLRSALKRRELPLYAALMHMLATIINRHEEFRYETGADGEPILFDRLNPSYTVFHKDTETFSNLWTEFSPRFADFCAAYRQDMQRYGDVQGFIGKPDAPQNCFPVSSVPWMHFTGFNLNCYTPGASLCPIFTFGRYEPQNGKLLLPLSGQFHHAVCDGYHAARLFAEMQQLADTAEEWID